MPPQPLFVETSAQSLKLRTERTSCSTQYDISEEKVKRENDDDESQSAWSEDEEIEEDESDDE